jgi:hypothetical protein
VTRHVPQLSHLHLRYCRHVSDAGVHAIAQGMPHLYSLDLGFCTKVTVAALVSLIEIRGHCLAELRLQACRNLDICADPYGRVPTITTAPSRGVGRSVQYAGGYAGRQLLAALRLREDSCSLSVLDVRQCGGQPSLTVGYRESDPFVAGMATLSFEQRAPGFFVRPARWNPNIEQRLVNFFGSITP